MITDYEANTWDWHDNEDERLSEMHDAAYYVFQGFLRDKRSQTQVAVRALYPRLYEGMDAHEIQQTVEEALYWLAIPDSWAQQFADEFEDNEYTGGFVMFAVEHWIEMEVNMLRDKGEWELDKDDE